MCINRSQSGFNGRIRSGGGTYVSGRFDAVSKRPNNKPQRGRGSVAMWFTCWKLGPVSAVSVARSEITIANEYDYQTTWRTLSGGRILP